MTSIRYDAYSAWSNYHLTLGRAEPGKLLPELRIEDAGRVHAGEPNGTIGFDAFAAAGAALRGHVHRVLKRVATRAADSTMPLKRPFAAGLVGRGWSFSPLIGSEASQLDCSGLTGCMLVPTQYRDPACQAPDGHLALVGGGTRLRELVDWGAQHKLTVRTSGTHLGPTFAGAASTASHGSRLCFGGIQNMVHGMHLITGPREHVWIERGSAPALTNAAARALGDGLDTPLRILRDDDIFDDALVHLGAMGIVNCMAVELVGDSVFELMLRDRGVDSAWLRQLSAGAFRDVAAWLGRDERPAFYEATLDPHGWNGGHALHTLYLPGNPFLPPSNTPAPVVRPADAIASLAESLSTDCLQGLDFGQFDAIPLSGPPGGGEVPIRLFDPHSQACSAFDYYRDLGGFALPIPPSGFYRWGNLHRDEITGGTPGALYNASFAIERTRLPDAIPAICEAVARLPRSFVFTIRFVSEPAGTLAFTRFEENAVIEIDGLSPFACRLAMARLSLSPKPDPQDLQLLKRLMTVLPAGAAAVRTALSAVNIPYSMHWAKLGGLDRAKVYADYGDPVSDPHSLIRRWRTTRDALLGPEGRAIFWNEAVVNYGLIERPLSLPPSPA